LTSQHATDWTTLALRGATHFAMFVAALVGVDKAHKLIRKWDATDAAVHDMTRELHRATKKNRRTLHAQDQMCLYIEVSVDRRPEMERVANKPELFAAP
jgi:hypothetical protein